MSPMRVDPSPVFTGDRLYRPADVASSQARPAMHRLRLPVSCANGRGGQFHLDIEGIGLGDRVRQCKGTHLIRLPGLIYLADTRYLTQDSHFLSSIRATMQAAVLSSEQR